MARLNARTFASLIYFEACGRLLSFTDAARELCVTTGAVSQQIRKLETEIGVVLFTRYPRGIALTPAGERLLSVTRQSVSSLVTILEELQKKPADDVVRLKSTPSFVFKWLIPKLQEFNRQYPEIKVEAYADAALLDLAGADFDLAIDYSQGLYLDFEATLLLRESLLPVVSPNYRPEIDWQSPDIWQQVSLLHDAMPWAEASRDAEWTYWLERSALKQVSYERGHYFNRVDMAIAAADAGLGVALARSALVEEELASGRLIAPFKAVASCCDYYLLMPGERVVSANAYILRDWLLAQVRQPESC
ncbi:MAG: LysR substrate-binding domain-containing protein [Pontibacterium sp.]